MAGKDCKAYVNTGTYGSKTWTELKRGTEFELAKGRGSSDFKMRGFTVVATALGYMVYAVTFKYNLKKAGLTDAAFAALETAFNSGADVELAFMDQAIATVGAKGIAGFFVITKFDKSEADEENPSVSIEVKPADHEESSTPVEVAPYTTPS